MAHARPDTRLAPSEATDAIVRMVVAEHGAEAAGAAWLHAQDIPSRRREPDRRLTPDETRRAAASFPGLLDEQPAPQHVARQLAPAPYGDPEKTAMDASRRRVVATSLRTLTPREERITRLSFGIGTECAGPERPGDDRTDDGRWTKAEIATVMSIGPERVRDIAAKAMRKLKHPSRSRPLRDEINQ